MTPGRYDESPPLTPQGAVEDRRAELAARLAAVEDRIGQACRTAGRPRADVTLITVTKFFPARDVELLAGLGVVDVGENKAQEAAAKVAALDPALRAGLRVHFVGQLQTNKARQVVGLADLVHAVDRDRLVTALDRAAAEAGRRVEVLLQVDLDPGSGADGGSRRGGARPDAIPALADLVEDAAHLELRGLMAVAPLGADPDEAFERLARTAERVQAGHPRATLLSAGMSGDLEAAVRHGATHLRVGSAILGARPVPR
ncbi:YggS family pyridoxal phosphate-dependent enzyme [Arsenicicoccus dermatophilus]|uniref:YggS family pyridoxal phosphate-dependent enzyme n=1 Tax=Arsenicicoccus dermatophilus TaxID=1076331 RepID=UPI001F4CDA29|nr:YggS family pyridoxal phosphate-dependent enzyme [Arsenicicoccus dermatophilus]MCH8613231.1 YggS family pyridoxal phosphate-dependent enzyme [Arsenicicoccus dermatophilus]